MWLKTHHLPGYGRKKDTGSREPSQTFRRVSSVALELALAAVDFAAEEDNCPDCKEPVRKRVGLVEDKKVAGYKADLPDKKAAGYKHLEDRN